MKKKMLIGLLGSLLLVTSVGSVYVMAEERDPHAEGQEEDGERDPHDGEPDQGGPDQGGPGGEETPSSGFVMVFSEDGSVFWKTGTEDAKLLLADRGWDAEHSIVARMVPDNEEEYPYLYPEKDWKLEFGTVAEEQERPDWFTEEMEAEAEQALEDWKGIVYSAFDYEAFREISASDTIDAAPQGEEDITDEDLAVFRKYVALEDSLCTFIKTSVNDSISNAFGASVASDIWNAINHGAVEEAKHASNVGSLLREMNLSNVGSRQNDFYGAIAGHFINLDEWLYFDGDAEGYPYECAWYLWEHGLVISQDSNKLWRLHSAADGTVFAEIPDEEVTVNKAFSAVLAEDGEIYWKKGRDNADAVLDTFDLENGDSYIGIWVKPELDEENALIALPDGNNPDVTKYFPYLDSSAEWVLTFEGEKPEWVSDELEEKIWNAFEEWRGETYGSFDLEQASQIFTEATREVAEYTEEDVALLKDWAAAWHGLKDQNLNPTAIMMKNGFQNVGSSLWDEVDAYLLSTWRVQHSDCPGAVVCAGYFANLGISEKDDYDMSVNDTVADSVSDAMEALTGSCFADIAEWDVYAGEENSYPYESAAELIRRNLVPCTDGENWYLTSGQDADIVYQIREEELLG